jgi:perosamine synthetase
VNGETRTAPVRAARHQAWNVVQAIKRKPLVTPPLNSATLEEGDVAVAARWLRDRSHWSDRSVVAQYEEAFQRWNGSTFAYAFASGRVALSACIAALGLRRGDEVLVPAYTCLPVPNAFRFAGITPVQCDIELDTYGLDVGLLEPKLSPRTRALLLHHLYGLVSRDYEALLEFAEQHGLFVIEDCAHAAGAEYLGMRVGNRGTVGFYSSEQSKVINTSQGGIAVSNDPAVAERLRDFYVQAPELPADCVERLLRNVRLNYDRFTHPRRWWRADVVNVAHGRAIVRPTTPEEESGQRPALYGARMSSPIAAVGLAQLDRLDAYAERRRSAAQVWDGWCSRKGYAKPLVVEGSVPVYLRYPVLVEPERKNDTRWAYEELGIELGTWYVAPPAVVAPHGCARAEIAYKRCVNFPTILPGTRGVSQTCAA